MGSNTINCSNCGLPNWKESEVCQHCGEKLPPFIRVPPITKEELLKRKVIKY